MIREPDQFISSGHHDAAATEYLNTLFHRAAQQGAYDVHMLWCEQACEIKLRLSGSLELYEKVEDGQLAKLLDEKIRSRANISAAERIAPQDGRMRLRFADRTIDVRISLIPIIGGQKIVCRILDQSNASRRLDSIEMTPMVRRALQEVIDEPQGMFLVVGPTGSGKTTTLYGLIAELNDGRRNIVTLEQPVEYVIPGICQINIDQHISFAHGLRATLRQDPDVILVGEIRDEETAKVAVQAANTGHLVLATLHANSAALAFTRLLDFGVDPHALASSMRGVLAQRLVRRITQASNPTWVKPTETELAWLEKHRASHVSDIFPAVESSDQYMGVMPAMELIRADAGVRHALIDQAGEAAILDAAGRQSQFETLAQASARLAGEGYTTLEQARRTVGDDALAPRTRRLGAVLVELGAITHEDAYRAACEQTHLRERGVVRRIGEILLANEACTLKQLVAGIGFTEGAPALIEPLIKQGRVDRLAVERAIAAWHASEKQQSLFDLCASINILNIEDLYEPSFLLSAGARQHHAALDREGAGHARAVQGSLSPA